jgi:hypothetical protein
MLSKLFNEFRIAKIDYILKGCLGGRSIVHFSLHVVSMHCAHSFHQERDHQYSIHAFIE